MSGAGQHKSSGWVRLVGAACAVVVMGAVGWGGGRALIAGPKDAAKAGKGSELAEVVLGLPESVDLVVALDDAAGVSETEIGKAVQQVVADGGVLGELGPAWKNLAAELGLSERSAFAELMGQRVIVATRAMAAPAQGREWALLSDVSLETERRLRDKLQAAPRSIDRGHQILSIEKGAYALTTHRRSGSTKSTIVLAPSGQDGLMSDIVRGLGEGEKKALRDRAVAAAAKRESEGGSNLLILARLDGMPGEGGLWDQFVVLAGEGDQADGRSWRSKVIVKRMGLGEGPPPPLVSDGMIRRLEATTQLVLVEAPNAREALGKTKLPGLDLFSIIPLPKAAQELVTGRRAVWVRSSCGGERVTVGIGLETTGPDSLAKSMDGAIARFVRSLEERFGVSGDAPLDFAGAMPTAVRVLPIRTPEDGVPLISKHPLVACWSYPRVELEVAGSTMTPGWWAMNVAQYRAGDASDPARVLAQDAEALTTPTPGEEMGRWAFLCAARPAELEKMLPAAVPDVRGFRAAMRRFERLGIRLSAQDDGTLEGEVTLRLAPPEQTSGGGGAAR